MVKKNLVLVLFLMGIVATGLYLIVQAQEDSLKKKGKRPIEIEKSESKVQGKESIPQTVYGEARINNGHAKLISSPFNKTGKALSVSASDTDQCQIFWKSQGLTPGKTYSFSFLHLANEETQLYVEVQHIEGDNEYLFGNPVISGRKERLFNVLLTVQQPAVQILIRIPAGKTLIIDNICDTVSSKDIRPSYLSRGIGLLRKPSLEVPDLFQGIKKLNVAVHVRQNDKQIKPPHIAGIVATTYSKIATALLPRILPGENDILVKYNNNKSVGKIALRITPNNGPKIHSIEVLADKIAPANNATFARVYLAAIDQRNQAISGALFRLRCPSSVKAVPYVQAISDKESEQTSMEFHLTSSKPGLYHIPIDIWNGLNWHETDQAVDIKFVKSEGFVAEKIKYTELSKLWFEPKAKDGRMEATQVRQVVDVALDASRGEVSVPLTIDSVAIPSVEWSVYGPATDLRVFNKFQADPRDLTTIASSIKDHVKSSYDKELERWMALELEEYVGLVMDNQLPTFYGGLILNTTGPTLRKGWGWCGPHASVVAGLALELGLYSRIHLTNNHVVAEVKGETLEPILLDPSVEARITDKSGKRVGLRTISDPTAYFTPTTGVTGRARRGDAQALDNYKNILAFADNWMDKNTLGIRDRHTFSADSSIFLLNLEPWETVQWTGGRVSENKRLPVTGHYHQSVMVKKAIITPADVFQYPIFQKKNLTIDKGRIQIKTGQREGSFEFSIEIPTELDGGFIDLDGATGDGGYIDIVVTPNFEAPPLVTPESFGG